MLRQTDIENRSVISEYLIIAFPIQDFLKFLPGKQRLPLYNKSLKLFIMKKLEKGSLDSDQNIHIKLIKNERSL